MTREEFRSILRNEGMMEEVILDLWLRRPDDELDEAGLRHSARFMKKVFPEDFEEPTYDVFISGPSRLGEV